MTERSAAALEAQESFEVHKEKNIDLLHSKAVGLLGVLFLTVTGAAPMSAMLGNVPFGAGFGNGIYIPAAFLLATIVLTIFSVGFAAMAQKVSSVGGFYSYISLGLGRDMGMAAGMASFVSYSVFEASLCGLFAYFGNAWIQTHLGINIPWIWFAVFMIALISILSYRDVQLSVKILGVALILEVIILVIFDAGAIAVEHVEFQCRGSQRPPRQHTGCGAEGGRCGHRGRRGSGRHLHGLLVLGRLRDGAQLRRGIARSQAHHSAARSITRSSGSGCSTSSRAGARSPPTRPKATCSPRP